MHWAKNFWALATIEDRLCLFDADFDANVDVDESVKIDAFVKLTMKSLLTPSTDQQLNPIRPFTSFSPPAKPRSLIASISMSLLRTARQFTGVSSKPRVLTTSLTRSTPSHRLNSTSNRPNSDKPPQRPASAPQISRSQFKILPIVILIAIGSGSYALLVKSRTGQSQSRPSN